MNIIVPLAGPEYFQESIPKGLKKSLDNQPQLLHTLKSRIWSQENNIIYNFIMKDSYDSRNFVDIYLRKWFPESNIIFLSNYTRGAALSSLAGLSMDLLDDKSPLVFDLADIYFETDIYPDFDTLFKGCSFLGYTFKSNLERYSYYEINDGRIVFAAEKKVISNHASAGVYVYKNSSVFLQAISKVISDPKKYLFNNLLYLCPIVNGVISNGQIGKIIQVKKFFDYK